VVLLLLSIAGLATGTALLWREQAQTKRAFDSAQANLDLALRALDQIYIDEAEGFPKIREGLPTDLLERGLRFYEEFARENTRNQHVAFSTGTAHHRAGLIFRELGQEDRAEEALDRAISTFREAIRLEPDLAVVHGNLGNALLAKGDPDGAIASYREAIRLGADSAVVHYNVGNALTTKGDLDGAIVSYREAIRLNPDDASAHNNLGSRLSDKGDLDGGIASFREAIRLKPDYAGAHYNLGSVLSDKGDPDGAIASYREALRVKPDYAEAHAGLGSALLAKGDPDGAIASYREAIRLKPDLAVAHYNLGNVLREGDLDGAIASYREAIRLRPDYAEAHGNLGLVLYASGDLDGAIASLREATRLKPDDAMAHANLGAPLFDKGNLDGAIASCREAIRLDPDYAQAHVNLGIALASQGRFREALSCLRRGQELASKRLDLAYPSKEWLDYVERKAELEARLDQMLSGEVRPRDALERIAFAALLYAQSRHAESARMYADAFAEDAALAEDLIQGHRYNAACSAALAAAGGDVDSAEWRGRAFEWLRADLAAHERAPSGLVAALEHRKQDPDLAAVRDRLDELPQPEREAWRSLWAAVDRTLAAARPAAK